MFSDLVKAADLQIPKAMWICGKCLLRGIGTERDDQKALDLLDQAARQHYLPARKRLGKYVQSVHDMGQIDHARALAQKLNLMKC